MTEQPLRRPTVAIVGSHPKTRTEFDFSRTDCDVWVFNEALKESWCKRADAVFQMHKSVIWRSTQNRNDPKHYEWLQRDDNPIIYMQDRYNDVPCSVRYPLDEIKAKFPRAYFTSSVSYAIALAVYLDYKLIEIYGVEMETQTEYGHQRTAVAYWVGVAEGRGIEVDFVSPTFFSSALYGYEGDIRIPIGYFEERITFIDKPLNTALSTYTQVKESANNLLDTWIKDYKTDLAHLDPLIVKIGQSGHDFGSLDGARQVNERYIKKCQKMQEETGNYLIVRQELEGYMLNATSSARPLIAELNELEKALKEAREALDTMSNQVIRTKLANEFREALEAWVQKATELGVINGVQLENRQAIIKHDEMERMAGGSKAVEIMKQIETSMEEDTGILEAELEAMSDNR